jgi:hypothetical protein
MKNTMSTALYIESFTTIDQCVAYLTSNLGVEWDSEKEQMLRDKMYYKHLDTIVFYDPARILEIPDPNLN